MQAAACFEIIPGAQTLPETEMECFTVNNRVAKASARPVQHAVAEIYTRPKYAGLNV
jgi:hypothetical protein